MCIPLTVDAKQDVQIKILSALIKSLKNGLQGHGFTGLRGTGYE